MRRDESQSGHLSSIATSTIRAVLVTAFEPGLLSEHARDISQVDPGTCVLQYVCHSGPGSVKVLRRHWSAGEAPTVALAAEDPGCVSCAIAADLSAVLARFAGAGIDRATIVLPAGADPAHMALRLEARGTQPVAVSSIQLIADASRLAADLESGADADHWGALSWEGDQRWLAMAVGSLISAADCVILRNADDHADAAVAAALAHHINPNARITQDRLAPALSGFRAELAAAKRDAAGRPFAVAQPSAGVRSSVVTKARPCHPQRLIDAISSIARHVLRVEAQIWLPNRPREVLQLHVSARMASLDVAGLWLREDGDWSAVTPNRQAAAAMNWHPEWGEARTHFIVTTLDDGHRGGGAHDAICEQLEAVLFDDSELADTDAWAAIADPFEQWLGEYQPPADPGRAHPQSNL